MNVSKIKPGNRYIVRERFPARGGFPALTRERVMTAVEVEKGGTVLMSFPTASYVPQDGILRSMGPVEWGLSVIRRDIPVKVDHITKHRHVKPTAILKEAS